MSGSTKGAKRRPYRTGQPTGYAHVLLRTAEEAANDAWEFGPTTAELLNVDIAAFPPTRSDVGADGKLVSTSKLKGLATDGKDSGADVDAVLNAVAGVVVP